MVSACIQCARLQLSTPSSLVDHFEQIFYDMLLDSVFVISPLNVLQWDLRMCKSVISYGQQKVAIRDISSTFWYVRIKIWHGFNAVLR